MRMMRRLGLSFCLLLVALLLAHVALMTGERSALSHPDSGERHGAARQAMLATIAPASLRATEPAVPHPVLDGCPVGEVLLPTRSILPPPAPLALPAGGAVSIAVGLVRPRRPIPVARLRPAQQRAFLQVFRI